jgi:hypothetical protein
MSTRFASTGPEGPQLGPNDAANLRTQFNALRADLVKALSGDYLISASTLSIGSTKPQVATTAFDFAVNGMPEAKAAVAAGTAFTATTHDITGGSSNSYLLSIATGGTITITMGTEAVGTTPGAAAALPAGEVAIGTVTIYSAAAGFDATTTDLDDADLTVTYTSAAIFGLSASLTSADLTAA